MLKTIFLSLGISALLFSANLDKNQSQKQNLTWNSLKKTFISKKETKYQEYRKKLEAENKKLEVDGFCSCNNN
ncbi:MAG: hypothetical protein GXP61_00300 [Epsilonproteobacteria bacterium]|nr:hypothetical protein [Campylobacterota bacterium]